MCCEREREKGEEPPALKLEVNGAVDLPDTFILYLSVACRARSL
jgi:hypothetical protein